MTKFFHLEVEVYALSVCACCSTFTHEPSSEISPFHFAVAKETTLRLLSGFYAGVATYFCVANGRNTLSVFLARIGGGQAGGCSRFMRVAFRTSGFGSWFFGTVSTTACSFILLSARVSSLQNTRALVSFFRESTWGGGGSCI